MAAGSRGRPTLPDRRWLSVESRCCGSHPFCREGGECPELLDIQKQETALRVEPATDGLHFRVIAGPSQGAPWTAPPQAGCEAGQKLCASGEGITSQVDADHEKAEGSGVP